MLFSLPFSSSCFPVRFPSLTPSNLSHYFKNCTSQSVLEYVQSLRKKEACRRLSQTDDPVQIVGAEVGMPNVSSFIRFFKQQTGVTPGQYRRQNRVSSP
ncbi:MAG: helix-turn-helix transcriptional regulator [Clostridia bacterium]|nr:helix-turn-helix transcriptional regulator [Clostridia bacterium]